MRRTLSSDDFKRVNDLVGRPDSDRVVNGTVFPDSACWVCRDYEIRGEHIVATERSDNVEHWSLFFPLEDAPDLFLRFSRLCKEPDFVEAALTFARRFGLPAGDANSGRHNDRAESLLIAHFLRESRRAWATLTLYECVLTGDDAAAREIFAAHREDDDLFREVSDALEHQPPGLECHHALWVAATIPYSTVERLCSQKLYMQAAGRSRPDPSWIKLTWEFDNVLGAMYLQMHQLVVAGGNVSRCENCQRIISLAPPRPGRRRPRKDKRFCDDACRQAHHRSKKKA